MAAKTIDVERQDEGEIVKFILGQQGVDELKSDIPGDGLTDRKRPGRLRKKLSTRPVTRFDEVKVSSKIESHDFFTQTWAEDQYRLSPLREPKKKASKSPPTDEESEIMSLVALTSQLVSQVIPAAYNTNYESLVQENLFIPSILPSDSSSKVDVEELRDLEEEGFFVGEKPFIPQTNLNIIENRFLRQNKKRWFLETGHLDRMDNPINDKIFHHLPNEGDVTLEPITVFIEPKFGEELLTSHLDDGGTMDMEISQLTFSHHPLFSPEHVLAARLKDYYKTYTERMTLNITKVLKDRLMVLRQAYAKLQQSDPRARRFHGSVHDEIDITQRLEIYRKEIKSCRDEYNIEAEKDRVHLTNMLRVWKEIKCLRKKNKFSCTPLKLIIKKEEVNKEEEEEERKEELRQDTKEILTELETEYEKQVDKYKKALTLWKSAYKKKKEAKKRQEKRKHLGIDEEIEESALTTAQDEVVLAMPDEEKPQPPEAVDKRQVELDVLDIFARTRKPPGEPNIQLELALSHSITKDNSCSDSEKRRRQAVSKAKVSFRVLINKKLVTQTPLSTLTNDFTIQVNQSYRMGLSSFPQIISLEIVEGSGLRETNIASVSLPIPGKSTFRKEKYDAIVFAGSQQVSCIHNGTGCGLTNSEYGSSFTKGSVSYHLNWYLEEVDELHGDSQPVQPLSVPPSSVRDTYKKTTVPGYERTHIDPNHPGNCELISHLQKAAFGLAKPSNYFEIDWCEGDFCSDVELDTSVRFRVLQLRDREEPAFKNLRLIPPVESQILRKSLEAYEEENLIGTGQAESTTTESHLWGIDRRWDNVEKLLASLRRHMQQRYMQSNLAFKLEDLVQEERIPDIGTIGTSLLSVFKPRRPLRPERKKRDQVRGTALGDQNVNLIVHIAQAFHVPVRHESSFSSGSSSSDIMQKENHVRPFIEATFQRSILRTSVAEGPNPTWNQQLSFPFKVA